MNALTGFPQTGEIASKNLQFCWRFILIEINFYKEKYTRS